MPTLGEVTVNSGNKNPSLSGRKNFLLKRALPTKQYLDFSKTFSENLDIAGKQIIAVTLSVALNPQNELLPVYFNIIEDKSTVDSIVIFPTYFEVTANHTLVMSNVDSEVLTDSGSVQIPESMTSLSISMTVYFLDEYPNNLVLQFIKEDPGPSSMTATLGFFTDVLS